MADTGDAAASPPDRRPSLSLDIAASSELAAAAAKPPSSPLPPSSSVPDTPVSTMEADESPTELATTPQEQARDERRGPLEVGGGGGGARATLAMEPAIPVSATPTDSVPSVQIGRPESVAVKVISLRTPSPDKRAGSPGEKGARPLPSWELTCSSSLNRPDLLSRARLLLFLLVRCRRRHPHLQVGLCSRGLRKLVRCSECRART